MPIIPEEEFQEYESERKCDAPWELLVSRHSDGSATLQFTFDNKGVALHLTDAERKEVCQILGNPEGQGFYRTVRKD